MTSSTVAMSRTLSPRVNTAVVSVAMPAGPVTATSASPALSAAMRRNSATVSRNDSSEAFPVTLAMSTWVLPSRELRPAAAAACGGMVAGETTPVTCSGRSGPASASPMRRTASLVRCASPVGLLTTINAGVPVWLGKACSVSSRARMDSVAAGGRLSVLLSWTDFRLGATADNAPTTTSHSTTVSVAASRDPSMRLSRLRYMPTSPTDNDT